MGLTEALPCECIDMAYVPLPRPHAYRTPSSTFDFEKGNDQCIFTKLSFFAHNLTQSLSDGTQSQKRRRRATYNGYTHATAYASVSSRTSLSKACSTTSSELAADPSAATAPLAAPLVSPQGDDRSSDCSSCRGSLDPPW